MGYTLFVNSPAIIPTRTIVPSQIDADALKVVSRLRRFGYSAYLVGGCVRDLLLKRQPKDFDVVTSALPGEIKRLFRNCHLIGRRFRLAHIRFGENIIETATFRANAAETQGSDLLIREDNVFGSEAEDACRRDFSINALFYDPLERQIVDYVGGLEDLVHRSLRFIGDPIVRVREDPVRILRAIKFAARLGFTIETQAWDAMVAFRHELVRSAPPRLLEEVFRMLRGGASAESFRLMEQMGILQILLPEIACYLDRRAQAVPAPGELPVDLLAVLRVIDRAGREVYSNPVLLAAVLQPVLLDAAQPDAGEYRLSCQSVAVGEVAHELLTRMIARLRLPKWEAERIQQIVVAQKRLWCLARDTPVPHSMLRRSTFPETLDLFSITVAASGQGRSILARLLKTLRPEHAESFRHRLSGLSVDVEGASEDSDPAPQPRPRRRRRGHRSRGGRAVTP